MLEGAFEERPGPGYGARTAVVAGFEVSNPLRRIDDLLEQARSTLVAMAATESSPTAPVPASAAAEQTRADDRQHGEGVVDGGKASLQRRAELVAGMLFQVAEASAVVRGDVLGRLQKERARNSECDTPLGSIS